MFFKRDLKYFNLRGRVLWLFHTQQMPLKRKLVSKSLMNNLQGVAWRTRLWFAKLLH